MTRDCGHSHEPNAETVKALAEASTLDQRKLSARAARRLYNWVKSDDETPPQVALDIGILIGRLAHFEGRGWLSKEEAE